MSINQEEMLESIKNYIDSKISAEEKLRKTAKLLKEEVDHYNWVGFYLAEESNSLILGPFSGEPTEHTEIDFGEGICGQAAEKEETFLIQDVSKEENYLSCSPEVDSEIVIPIFDNDKIIGEIDIDSHQISPFNIDDEKFLEEIADLLTDTVKSYLDESI